jgi:hypothetical protein
VVSNFEKLIRTPKYRYTAKKSDASAMPGQCSRREVEIAAALNWIFGAVICSPPISMMVPQIEKIKYPKAAVGTKTRGIRSVLGRSDNLRNRKSNAKTIINESIAEKKSLRGGFIFFSGDIYGPIKLRRDMG